LHFPEFFEIPVLQDMHQLIPRELVSSFPKRLIVIYQYLEFLSNTDR